LWLMRPLPNWRKPMRNRDGLVCGVAINDADYVVQPTINGVRTSCPYYVTWISMIRRCYGKTNLIISPSYIGCTVSRGWLTFSIFKAWMELQEWEGKQLDKDILVEGNKIYSAEACAFVDSATNNILIQRVNKSGLMAGITAKGKRFVAQGKDDGKGINLGTFDTEEEANNVYLKNKSLMILKCALRQEDERVKMALIKRAEDIVELTY